MRLLGPPTSAIAPPLFAAAALVAALVCVSPETALAQSPPSISLSFSPTAVPVNGSSTLTISVINPNGGATLTGVGFTDVLPSGLVDTNGAGSFSLCGGTFTISSGQLSYSGTFAPGVQCSINTTVQPTSAGTFNNVTSAITSDQGIGSAATATLIALSPPTISAAFTPSSIAVNQSSQLSFTITNPNTGSGLTGVSFNAALPAGLAVATPNNLSNSCGATATASGGSISLTGGTLGNGGTCTISASVIASTAATFTVATSAVNSSNGGTGSTATATLTALSPPTISAAFTPSSIAVNQNSQLSFTITNPNTGSGLTGVSFSAALPAGLAVATPSNLSNSCGATATASGGSISLTSGTLGNGGTCTISASVIASTAATFTVASSTVSSSNGGTGNTATATLTALSPPTISAAFTPSSIAVNQNSQLSFTITNPNTGSGLTGVSFSAALPAGLAVATPSNLSNSCGATATASGGSISLTGGTLGNGGTCTISASVIASTAATFTVATSAVSSSNGGSGNTASASLTVPGALSLAEGFGASSIPVNGSTSLTFTITNGNAGAQTGVGFTDSLPAGLVVATPNGLVNTCGGTATASVASISLSGGSVAGSGGCTFTVNVTGTNSGNKTNTTSAVTSTLGGNGNSASASVAVVGAVSVSQAFGTSPIPLNGSTALTFTITNPGQNAQTGVAFTDNLPAGLVVANVASNACAGSVTANAGASVINLSAGTVSANGSCSVIVNVTGTSAGTKTNTVGPVSSNEGGTGNSATATLIVGGTTSTTIASSLNPSQAGQSVTFTATVTSNVGTPAGTVSFKDGAVVLSTVALTAGTAVFTTASLTVGNHSITAAYAGNASFPASTSAVLTEVVNVPADSLKLRAMQALAAPVVSQTSGQAIAGAIDSAIGEAFSPGGAFATPSANGVRFNFAADPEATPARAPATAASDPFARVGASPFGNGNLAANPAAQAPSTAPTRIDDGFNALAYAAPTKAAPLAARPQSDWFGWAEVRGAVLNHWNATSLGSPGGTANLYGDQINLLAGLSRKLTPGFVVGVLGGYETFDYRSDALQGRLKGDGWTVGSYLGWLVTANIRFTAGVAYSGIGYDGSAGTAAGNFDGRRILASGGFTGAYEAFGLQIEPSARVYALWEHEDAYTDTLGTQQAAANFFTGRASAGAKLTYPFDWSETTRLAPYLGLYGDYYFNSTDAVAPLGAPALPSIFLFDGWSARAVGGLSARFANDTVVAVGAERGGVGSNFAIWTYRARASVPIIAR